MSLHLACFLQNQPELHWKCWVFLAQNCARAQHRSHHFASNPFSTQALLQDKGHSLPLPHGKDWTPTLDPCLGWGSSKVLPLTTWKMHQLVPVPIGPEDACYWSLSPLSNHLVKQSFGFSVSGLQKWLHSPQRPADQPFQCWETTIKFPSYWPHRMLACVWNWSIRG